MFLFIDPQTKKMKWVAIEYVVQHLKFLAEEKEVTGIVEIIESAGDLVPYIERGYVFEDGIIE